ncbi:hypothetical protein FJY69_07380 [candidate division WOR-3 bacterium]|nr:hypothetical protein [candidate division WOR-3 bacterium]
MAAASSCQPLNGTPQSARKTTSPTSSHPAASTTAATAGSSRAQTATPSLGSITGLGSEARRSGPVPSLSTLQQGKPTVKTDAGRKDCYPRVTLCLAIVPREKTTMRYVPRFSRWPCGPLPSQATE